MVALFNCNSLFSSGYYKTYSLDIRTCSAVTKDNVTSRGCNDKLTSDGEFIARAIFYIVDKEVDKKGIPTGTSCFCEDSECDAKYPCYGYIVREEW